MLIKSLNNRIHGSTYNKFNLFRQVFVQKHFYSIFIRKMTVKNYWTVKNEKSCLLSQAGHRVTSGRIVFVQTSLPTCLNKGISKRLYIPVDPQGHTDPVEQRSTIFYRKHERTALLCSSTYVTYVRILHVWSDTSISTNMTPTGGWRTEGCRRELVREGSVIHFEVDKLRALPHKGRLDRGFICLLLCSFRCRVLLYRHYLKHCSTQLYDSRDGWACVVEALGRWLITCTHAALSLQPLSLFTSFLSHSYMDIKSIYCPSMTICRIEKLEVGLNDAAVKTLLLHTSNTFASKKLAELSWLLWITTSSSHIINRDILHTFTGRLCAETRGVCGYYNIAASIYAQYRSVYIRSIISIVLV